MTNTSKLFSTQAVDYARYRPLYNREVYEYLSKQVPNLESAWDCGTGNGQAAIGLAEYFIKVIATDPTPEQLKNAIPHPRVEYRLAAAEESGLSDKSMDLITAANAAHWFDREKFYQEARRILKPKGIIALWRYDWHMTGQQPIDELIVKFSEKILDDFWSPKVKKVRKGYYDDAPFPFEDLPVPKWTHQVEWSMDELCGYFNSWSATQSYIKEKGSNPVDLIHDELLEHWGNPSIKRILSTPLQCRIGRVP